jgi:hypothetical protein
MLRFEWNSLRIGDEVLVHDARDRELALIPGLVAMVDTKKGANGVGIRVVTADGVQVQWPSYLAVHHDPPDQAEPCWRCAAIAERRVKAPTQAAMPVSDPASANSHGARRTA